MGASTRNTVKTLVQKLTAAGIAIALVAGVSPALSLVETAHAEEATQQQTAQADQGTTQNSNTQTAPDGQGGTPPTPPDGAAPGDGSTPPTPPDGEAPGANGQGGTPPSMPDGQAPSGSAPGQGGPGGGADTMNFDYSGTYAGTLAADNTETTSQNETLEATDADVNVVLAQNGGTATVEGGTLTKQGDDTDGDRCNFYGANSIALAVGEGSQVNVSDTQASATSQGSNGLFATDSGTVFANNVTINTTADNSRGLDATYGGTIVANNTTISTQGEHCAGVATDRGGGNISVANSNIETAGSGSPILYSTGDIEVENIQATASGSQIAGMEGLNSILIKDSQLTSTVTGKTASDPVANGVIIYQSTSGDAEATTGDTATFTAVDSTLSSAIESGSMFYLTNTSASVVLQNTTLDYNSEAANLITAQGNDANNWGTAGKNGAQVTFTGVNQQLEGNIDADTISSVNLFLTNGSTWKGSASITENANGSTSEAPITVNVDGTSTWTVTDSCTISALHVAEGGKVLDANGEAVTIVAADKTVVEGSSTVVTVDGAYDTTVELTEANEADAGNIDRSAFNTYFNIDETQQASASASSEASAATSADTSSASADTSSASATSANTSSDATATQSEGFFGWLWRTITGVFNQG